jgi:glycosyltransferase involved in cell wall biosynthesis
VLTLKEDKVMIILEGMELPRLRIYRISEKLIANKITPVIVGSGRFKLNQASNRKNTIAKEVLVPSLLKYLPLDFPRQLFLNFIALPILLLTENPKLVVLSIPDGSPIIPTFLLCKILRKKLIIDIRDEWEEIFRAAGTIGALITELLYKVYASADMLTVVTPNFLKKYKTMNANTFLIFNGVDNSLFKPLIIKDIQHIRDTLGLKPNDFVIIYSGKLSPPYRLDVVLKSLKILKTRGEKDIKLLVIGKTGYKYGEKVHGNDILTLAYKLGIEDMVKTLPFMPHSELVKYIEVANAGVIPYDADPLWKNTISIKFFEYCAAGLPIIATAHPDSVLVDTIHKYKVGVTTPPLDHAGLADIMQKLKNDNYLTSKIGANASRAAKSHFDAEKEYSKFARLIKSLLGGIEP